MKLNHKTLNHFAKGVSAIVLTASFGASAAMIKSNSDAVKVDARGLDLNSQQGHEVLYERLETAVKKVCGETTVHGAGSLKRAVENRTCYDASLSKAVESVGSELLTNIHRTS